MTAVIKTNRETPCPCDLKIFADEATAEKYMNQEALRTCHNMRAEYDCGADEIYLERKDNGITLIDGDDYSVVWEMIKDVKVLDSIPS